MILLTNIETGDFLVYRTDSLPYEQDANLVLSLPGLEENRWDPEDPHVLWGQRDFSIVKLNVLTGVETVVKNFGEDATIGPILTREPDLYRITMRDEGESSRDKRYWAFLLQGTREDYRARYLFTWDRERDHVLGLYEIPLEEASIDWVGMSMLGKWVLIGADYDNGGNLAGLTMADRELTRFHRLNYGTGHSDVGLDTNGNEVIVMQNSRTDHVDLIPIDWNTQPTLDEDTAESYEGTNRTPLVRLFYSSDSPQGFASGVHISCNAPGYCVMSTYIETQEEERNWFDRTNILVKLDPSNPAAFYLSKVYGTYQAYWEETHATISNDASAVLWASNWNRQVGEEEVFLMRLDLPALPTLAPVVVDSEKAEVNVSFRKGQSVDLTCKAEPGAWAEGLPSCCSPRFNPVPCRFRGGGCGAVPDAKKCGSAQECHEDQPTNIADSNRYHF